MDCSRGIAGRTRSKKPLPRQHKQENSHEQSNSDDRAKVVGDGEDDVIVVDGAQQQENQTGNRCSDSRAERRRERKIETERGEFGIRRRKSYGLDILIDENAREEEEEEEEEQRGGAAQRTRSHFPRSKKLKLGTFSQPICLDDEEDNRDHDHDHYHSEAKTSEWSDEEDEWDREGHARNAYACVRERGRVGKHSGKKHVHAFKWVKKGIDELWGDVDSALEEGSGSVEERYGGFGGREEGSAVSRKKRGVEDFGVVNALRDSICGEGEVPLEGRDDEHELNPNVVDLPPLKFIFQTGKPKPAEKSQEEKELDTLWTEMEYCLNLVLDSSVQNDSQVQNNTDSNHDQCPRGEVTRATLCRQGNHDFFLDEEIGLICTYCSHIGVEIKYWTAPFYENLYGKSYRGDSCTWDHVDHSVINELQQGVAGHHDHNPSDYTGTVWDLIPGVKKTMYPHQCEAFEFLWSNLAGGIFIDKLKEQKEFPGGSGCIISHAPGTGKTRLTIVFLQAYMELYPTCRPIIIAPKGILGTWEEEFKTWKVDIPFHNLNNPEYSGKESEVAMNLIKNSVGNVSKNVARSYCRLVKLYSWKCDKSILGIGYPLFEQLARKDSNDKVYRKALLEHPGLLVLDEGHTPRNSQTHIWKAVSKIQTKRRIILSGTPFQNNFEELYNTLRLARPKFADGDKLVFDDKRGNPRNESKGKWVNLANSIGKVTDDSRRLKILEEIRSMILPFVHVHQGTILQETLPGLRKLVVYLKPTQLQKEVFEEIQKKRKRLAEGKGGDMNVLKLEYEESVTAVHPALFNPSEGKKFQRFRLNPEEGVKTKFVMELIKLCGVVNEQVLVFSQYIRPLKLLASQLKYHFGWNEGREVLKIHGKIEPKQRQASIEAFNDPRSKVRVMLASTRACYEGISLVGASRVVLLDVVWNPSVERQAISRAYRLGQKKFVYTYHLITAGTRDEEKCCRQAEKDKLSELVFFNSHGAQHCQNLSSAKLEDRILEDMVQHEKYGHIFEKVAINYEEAN